MITLADVVALPITNADTAAALKEYNASREAGTDALMRKQFPGQRDDDYMPNRYFGLLGQAVAARYYGVDPFGGACVNHDATVGGRTVDFKSARTFSPTPGLDRLVLVRAGLPAVQRPAAYVSVEVNTYAGVAWLYGWVTREDYMAGAALVRRGERLNGFTAKFADTLALPHRELNPAGGLRP